ncbi:glycosyltransferase [Candidatus Sumerlaeota bacterium]|nr:glycosyltransferase [Candidatus Sumerlaeota bacterium]
MDRPYFSIVIPARDEAAHISHCLTSVQANSHADVPFEVIVVDDSSTDRTAEIAREHGATVLSNTHRAGGSISRSRNMGAAVSQGDVIVFLDADMTVPPDWLARAKEYFDQGFKGLLHFPMTVPGHAHWVGRVWESRHQKTPPAVESTVNISSANMLISRAVFDEVGGFDERLRAAEDKDLALRVSRAGYPTLRLPGPELYHHGYERSLIEFLRKESWRQGHTLQLAFKHGMTFRAMRNPLFSFLHLICAAIVTVSVIFLDVAYGAASMGVWLLPSFFLAMRRRRGPLRHFDRFRLFFLQWLRWNVSGVALIGQLLRLPSLKRELASFRSGAETSAHRS